MLNFYFVYHCVGLENNISSKNTIENKAGMEELLCVGNKVTRHQVIFISLSYALAAFDFLVYVKLAEVISTIFFPATNSTSLTQLKIIGLISVGYLARPLGGLLIGRYGDKHGRKPALLISICFLAVTTLLTAFLPTYAQVGVLAPILFLIIRILQGMAFGGHTPLSWVFVAEHAPKNRLATYCSLAVAGGIFGSVLAISCAKLLTGILDTGAMLDYGWRIPAIIGGVLSALTLLMWRHVEETPVYTRSKDTLSDKPHTLGLKPFITRSSAMMLSVSLSFVRHSLIMVVMLLLPKLIALKFYSDPSFLVNVSLIALVMQILGCIIYGMLADKIGTGKTFMLASVALTLQVWMLYVYLANGNDVLVIPLYGLLGFCTGMIGLCIAIFVQVFPTNIRLTAVSVIYNVIAAILGAALPLFLFYSTEHISFAPALYLTFIGILCFIIGLHLHHRETFGELYTRTNRTKKYNL